MYQLVNKDKILHWLNYFQKLLKVREATSLGLDLTITFSPLPSFNPGAGLPADKKKGGPSPGDVEAIKVRKCWDAWVGRAEADQDPELCQKPHSECRRLHFPMTERFHSISR